MNKKILVLVVIIVSIILALSVSIKVQNQPNSKQTLKSTDQILAAHDFNSWSAKEKEDLIEMMRVAASGETVNLDNKTRRVLETYIELLEAAGYK